MAPIAFANDRGKALALRTIIFVEKSYTGKSHGSNPALPAAVSI
jgi:hypothetical protein